MPETPLDQKHSPTPPRSSAGGWTIVLLCIGIALIACCVLIPQADENRRLAYQREKLKADLEQVERQISVNGEFLRLLSDDPTLAERLAQRQMKVIREGTSVLDIEGNTGARDDMSPFLLVNVPPPAPMPPYQPIGGVLARMCRDARSQLYLIGTGLMMMAVGLVLGYTPKPECPP